MTNTNSVPRFDRHKHMSFKTMDAIMDAKRGLWSIDFNITKGMKFKDKISNMLAGLFDGHDYSQMIINDPLLGVVKAQDKKLFTDIVSICDIVSNYPKL